MRFLRLHAVRFGPLNDLDLELPRGVVVIHGPNMAGKTSFREALETTLYGFAPAQRATHPLWTWLEGANLLVETDLEPHTGNAFRVERELQANGKLRRAEPGAEFAGTRLGNQALAELAATSRELFRAVYSLTLDDLHELDKGVSEDIDHLLLPAASGLRVRSSREVIRELESECVQLWRPDRLGNPRSKQIQQEQRELKRRRAERADEETKLRGARDELAAIQAALPELEAERREVKRQHEEAVVLGEIFALRRDQARLGAPPDAALLGEYSLDDPDRLQRRVDELEAQLLPSRARLKQPPLELDPVHVRVIAESGAIEGIERGRYSEQQLGLDKARQAATEAERRLRAGLDEVLVGQASDEQVAALREVSTERVGAAADEWTDAAVDDGSADLRGVRAKTLGGVGVGLGLLLVTVGLVTDGAGWLVSPGALLVGAGAVALWLGKQVGGRAAGARRAPAALRDSLGRLDVHESLLDSPQGARRLHERLRDLRAQALALDKTRAEIEHTALMLKELEGSWRTLLDEIGLASKGADVELAVRLETALKAARGAAGEVDRDKTERSSAQAQSEVLKPSFKDASAHLEAVGEFLRQALPSESDARTAYERLVDQNRQRTNLEIEGDKLRRNPEFDRLFEALPGEPEVEPEDAPWHDGATRERELRLEDLEQSYRGKLERRGALRRTLEDAPESAVARVEEQMAALADDLDAVKREHDRLALLAKILNRADQAFREEHQPDVLRSAEAYLTAVTGGAIRNVEYVEGDEITLQVTPADRGEPVPVEPPLSRGTRDQIHLCLRLGLIDHLDRDGEPLPLVLDEVLVNWDAKRRAQIYPLLSEVAKRRQVFILTCHEPFAAEAEQALGTTRITLGDG